jgi:hypothetical protein
MSLRPGVEAMLKLFMRAGRLLVLVPWTGLDASNDTRNVGLQLGATRESY